jgi:hypothetical protein
MEEDGVMEARTVARLAWTTFGMVALGLVGALGLLLLNRTGERASAGGEILALVVLGVAMLSFPVVGVLIASRQPRNTIGWILLAIGFVWEVGGALGANYVQYGLFTAPGSLPGPEAVAVLASSVWVPGLGLIGTFLVLLFPDGRLPSRRWAPLAWLCGLTLTVLWMALTFSPGTLPEITGDSSMPDVANPLGIDAVRPFTSGPIYVVLALLPVCFFGCALSLIKRFRRSHGRERQQLKWLAAAAGTTATLFFLSIGASFVTGQATESSSASQPLWLTILDTIGLFSFILIPVAIGIAVLRHRLYDIDLIINRALVYGALSAALGAVYFLGVTVLQGLFSPITGESSLAVAGSTLVVAALFRPARTRIQSFIDRRFYRSRYDATRTVEEFSIRLRDEVDLENLSSHLLGVVEETLQPTRVSLWLRSL